MAAAASAHGDCGEENGENSIVHIEKTISTSNGHFLDDILEILNVIRPQWKVEQVKTKAFTGGITNRLVGCWEDDLDDVVLFRIYGRKTEAFVDREMEKLCMELLWPLKCGPQLYAVFGNGLCYRYLPGVHLEHEHLLDERICRLLCSQLVKMHQVKLPPGVSREPCLFPKIWKFFSLLPETLTNSHKNRFVLPDKQLLKLEIEELEKHLSKLGSPAVFCHNDALLRNIIYNDKPRSIAFIDFEYAGSNYQAYDIGNHFNEFAGLDEVDYSLYPDKKYQMKWLKTYLQFWYEGLGKDPSLVGEDEVETLYVQVNKFALSSHMMWGLWAIVQSLYSNIDFDYLRYASIRLNEYFTRKKAFLGL